MSGEFDPYHKWLGISPREQPPHHYRLLAIDLFEDDPEVIDSAANRQMSYLQELASGPNVRHAQNLLNEISAARVCLLDKQRKADYDAKLKTEVAAQSPSAPSAAPPSPPPTESRTPLPSRPSARPQVSPPPQERGPVIDTGRGPGIAIDTRTKAVPTRSDTQRTAKTVGRPKSKSNTPIIVSAVLMVVVVICAGIAFGVLMSGNSTDATLAQQTPDSARPSVNSDRRDNDTHDHRQTPLPSADPSPAPNPSSDIPAPGANVPQPSTEPPKTDSDNHGVETEPLEPTTPDQPKVNPQDPPAVDPPAVKPAPINPPKDAGPPESLKQAYEALQQKNVEQVIALLEKCVADNPPSPYKEEAEKLLAQAKTAISDEVAKKVLRDWARKLTDQQVQAIANGKPANIQITVPVQHPILAQIFIQRAGKHFQSVMIERLNGKIPDEQVAANDDDKKPIDNEKPAVKDDPKPETPQTAARPTDPAALLAEEGLTKDGGRWALAGLEEELKDQLAKVTTLQKKVDTARNAVSSRQRAALMLAKKELAQRRAAAEKDHEDAIKPGNLIEVRDQEKYEKRLKELKEVEAKINVASEKVTQADIAASEAIEELKPELEAMEKMIQSFEDTYDRVANDAEVLAAIEKQGGGAIDDSTVVKAAKKRALALRKEFGGVSELD